MTMAVIGRKVWSRVNGEVEIQIIVTSPGKKNEVVVKERNEGTWQSPDLGNLVLN